MKNEPVMQTRIVGVFESRDHADNVADLLTQKGIPRDQITLSHVGEHRDIPGQVPVQESVFDELNHFFHSLFDDADEEKIREAYARATKTGNVVVSVDTRDGDQAKKISDFMSDIYRSKGREKPSEKSPEKTPAPRDAEQKHLDAATSGIPESLVFTNIFDKVEDEAGKP
ncbi:hypothetical protein NB640_01230 [Oxalobacter vibrioformis]|uniref:Uncharacterized protein n=1 Tax=Oxalobacter vibrioformis TaxID=933080 RepID=A0A9E9P3R5_9BURK|nr:hypothetical protein [Oxalobacter vibrioformis]WAW10318.1 hypothetical protein NB640_01230 [Oxalobacter vibrioformis]